MNLAAIEDFTEWAKARSKVESKISATLGPIAGEAPDLQVKTIDELDFPGFTRRRINYFVSDWERISAWLFVPEHVDEDAPAIICMHDRVPRGKDEAAGLEGDPHNAFAQYFAEQGYVTLAPDLLTSGERRLGTGIPYDSSSWYAENPKACLLGKFVADHMRAIDVLAELREADEERVGVIGHGLGGTNALMLAALDERVRTTVSSCGFVPFADDSRVERWFDDEDLCLIPKLKSAAAKGEYPFDWDEVLALAAPNPMFVISAQNDEVFPDSKSCKKSIDSASKIYAMLSESNAFEHHDHKEGRRMTFGLLEQADEWFDRWL